MQAIVIAVHHIIGPFIQPGVRYLVLKCRFCKGGVAIVAKTG